MRSILSQLGGGAVFSAALRSVFLKILAMSLAASAVIVAVLLLRLVLRRAPKFFSYLLWAVVLLRLLCPVLIESPLGLIPKLTIDPTGSSDLLGSPRASSSIDYLSIYDKTPDYTKNSDFDENNARPSPGYLFSEGDPVTLQSSEEAGSMAAGAGTQRTRVVNAVSGIWLAGSAMLFLYAAVQYALLRRRLVVAVQQEGRVYIADHIDTAFVLGLFRPRIYLPSGLADYERVCILAHEERHIRRGDPVWRLLAFLALCLHWFDPLVWLAFFASRRDMEMSCDEAVIRQLGRDVRADYAESLLRLAGGRTRSPLSVLAFGESDTKARVSNVMRWKKPALWVVVLAALLCLAAAACFATSAGQPDPVVNPAVGAYAPGDGISRGNVDAASFEMIDPAFEIGRGADGVAVFKDPNAAWSVFCKKYKDAIERIGKAWDLGILNAATMEMYKTCGWQTEGADEMEAAENAFVTRFLDIYENSFRKGPGSASTDAAPTKAETEVSAGTAPAADEIVSWPLDLTGDGTVERLELNVSALFRDLSAAPCLLTEDGSVILPLPEIGLPHSGWNTMALYEDSGKQGILFYQPYRSTGLMQYRYTLFTAAPDGRIQSVEAETPVISLDLPMSNEEIDGLLRFVEQANAILARSTILVSSDDEVIGGLCKDSARSPGSFLEAANSPVVAHSGEKLYYHEELGWLRRELAAQGSYARLTEGDTDGQTLRDCLEYRNFLMQISSKLPSEDLSWPIEDATISAPFSEDPDRLHTGIDLAAESGTPICAAADGVVIRAGFEGNYGNVVTLDHGGGLVTRYAHCSELLVSEGDNVEQGQEIAKVGASGVATGPHCHFEIRAGDEPQDPLVYLNPE